LACLPSCRLECRARRKRRGNGAACWWPRPLWEGAHLDRFRADRLSRIGRGKAGDQLRQVLLAGTIGVDTGANGGTARAMVRQQCVADLWDRTRTGGRAQAFARPICVAKQGRAVLCHLVGRWGDYVPTPTSTCAVRFAQHPSPFSRRSDLPEGQKAGRHGYSREQAGLTANRW